MRRVVFIIIILFRFFNLEVVETGTAMKWRLDDNKMVMSVEVEIHNLEVAGTAMTWWVDKQLMLMMTVEMELKNHEDEETECAMNWRLKVC